MHARIVLVDDHEVVLTGLKVLLEGHSEFELAGHTTDSREALSMVDRLAPNVLVVDLMMPGMNGLELLRQVQERHPRVRTIVLSMHSDEAYVYEALRNGAAAFVLKQSKSSELVRALRVVLAGGRYLSPPLSDELLARYQDRSESTSVDPYDTLTQREREVLQLAAEGRTSVEIAHRLSISKRTVDTHRANLTRKLAIRTQADLVRYAIRRGIIQS